MRVLSTASPQKVTTKRMKSKSLMGEGVGSTLWSRVPSKEGLNNPPISHAFLHGPSLSCSKDGRACPQAGCDCMQSCSPPGFPGKPAQHPDQPWVAADSPSQAWGKSASTGGHATQPSPPRAGNCLRGPKRELPSQTLLKSLTHSYGQNQKTLLFYTTRFGVIRYTAVIIRTGKDPYAEYKTNSYRPIRNRQWLVVRSKRFEIEMVSYKQVLNLSSN